MEIEYYSAVILVDRYYRRRILGRVVLGLSYIIRGVARLKVAKMAAGMAVTLRTITLAKDRLVNKPHLSIALQP